MTDPRQAVEAEILAKSSAQLPTGHPSIVMGVAQVRTYDLEKACRELLEKAKREGVSIETLQALLGSLNAN